MKPNEIDRALNDVDDDLLDRYAGQPKIKRRSWTGWIATAACFCLLAAGALLWRPWESETTPAMELPGVRPERPAAAQDDTQAAGLTDEAEPTPLAELPQLEFEEESTASQIAADIGYPEGYFIRTLSPAELAEIWGMTEDSLTWEGASLEALSLTGEAIYDGRGRIWQVTVRGTCGEDGQFRLYLSPEHLPPDCLAYESTETCTIHGTPVEAVYYSSSVGSGCTITFLRGQGESAVGARIEAAWQTDGTALIETLTRLVSQSLREDGVLQLTQLNTDEIPVWRSESLTEAQARAEEGFGSYLPQTVPDGYTFSGAHRELGEDRDWMSASWMDAAYQGLFLTVNKLDRQNGLVHAWETEQYDRRLYYNKITNPDAPQVPEEYWESWSDPLFYADELTWEMIEARIWAGDDCLHADFRLLYPDGSVLCVDASGDREQLQELLSFLLPQ